MATDVPAITAAFKKAAAFPSVSGAVFLESKDSLSKFLVSYSQRDLQRMLSRKYMRTFAFIDNQPLSFPMSLDMEGVTNYAFNQSGHKVALARSVPSKEGGKDKPDVFIEIWEDGFLSKVFKTAGKCGPVYDAENVFAGFKWCSDDKRLVFTAEKIDPETAGFFEPAKADAAQGSKHVRRESWGEGFPSCYSPVVVILNTETEEYVFPLSKRQEESVSWGSPLWTPDGTSLIVVGWPYEHRKLGVKFCLNRPSSVFHVQLEPHLVEQISSNAAAARSPLFTPGGSALIWIENEVGGPHAAGSKLVRCDWGAVPATAAASAAVVLPVPQLADELGVYGARLPQQCFVNEHTMVFTTFYRSTRVAVRVDLATASITRLATSFSPTSTQPASSTAAPPCATATSTPPTPSALSPPAAAPFLVVPVPTVPVLPLDGVVDVLAVCGASALVVLSSPAAPPCVCLGRIDGAALALTPLTPPRHLPGIWLQHKS